MNFSKNISSNVELHTLVNNNSSTLNNRMMNITLFLNISCALIKIESQLYFPFAHYFYM